MKFGREKIHQIERQEVSPEVWFTGLPAKEDINRAGLASPIRIEKQRILLEIF